MSYDRGAFSLLPSLTSSEAGCVLLQEAQMACATGDLRKATRLLEQAAISCDRPVLLTVLAGDLEYAVGDMGAALDDWLSIEDGAEVVYRRAHQLLSEGRAGEAASILKMALQNERIAAFSDEAVGSMLELLGRLAMRQGDWSAVVLAYEQAIALKSIRREGYVFLGQAHRELGAYQSSLQALELGFRAASPEDPVFQAALLEQSGATLAAMGERTEAVSSYERALMLLESAQGVVAPERIQAVRSALERLQE
jgi:tetratricopeptide (TPR) repeat protein